MAFVSRIGNVLKHAGKHNNIINSSASTFTLKQAIIRCMSSAVLYVGGLPYSVDEANLWESFAQHGKVLEARIIIGHNTQRSRGYGFVSYASSEDATRAINAMDGQDFQGRRLKVAHATEKPSQGYGGDGGYGSGNYSRVPGPHSDDGMYVSNSRRLSMNQTEIAKNRKKPHRGKPQDIGQYYWLWKPKR